MSHFVSEGEVSVIEVMVPFCARMVGDDEVRCRRAVVVGGVR